MKNSTRAIMTSVGNKFNGLVFKFLFQILKFNSLSLKRKQHFICTFADFAVTHNIHVKESYVYQLLKH